MRAVFSAVPGYGHLLPLLPLARAARAAGAQVLVASHQDLRSAVGDLPFRGVGPSVPQLLEETSRRYSSNGTDLTPAAEAGLFTDSRVALTYPAMLKLAQEFGPDVIIADDWDFVAPLVAAALGVPWIAHGVTRALPAPALRAMTDALQQRAGELGVQLSDRVALITIWPQWLQADDFVPAPDVLAMQPTPHADGTAEPFTAHFPGREHYPVVLFTLGTVVRDVGVLTRSVRQLAALDLNVITTIPDGVDIGDLQLPADRVIATPFVPMGQLLQGVSVVVSTSGAGTALSALGYGLPMVLLPVLADQPVLAAALAALGVAIVCEDADQVAAGVKRVLTDPGFTVAAQAAAKRLAAARPPAEIWAVLQQRLQSRVLLER